MINYSCNTLKVQYCLAYLVELAGERTKARLGVSLAPALAGMGFGWILYNAETAPSHDTLTVTQTKDNMNAQIRNIKFCSLFFMV